MITRVATIAIVICGTLPEFTVPERTEADVGFMFSNQSTNKTVSSTTTPTHPCVCNDVSLTISFNDSTGVISFTSNDPTVSPGTTTYNLSSTIDVPCTPPDTSTSSGGTINTSTHNAGFGNASATVPNTTSVNSAMTASVNTWNNDPLHQPDCVPATGYRSSMVVTYTFSRPATGTGCEGGTCQYYVSVTISFNSSGAAQGMT